MDIDFAQARAVIVLRILDRGVEILADADAAYAPVAAVGHARDQMIDALVVESHAVDERATVRNAEHPWARVARLRPRGHGAELDVAETHRPQRIQEISVLVEARRQPYGV